MGTISDTRTSIAKPTFINLFTKSTSILVELLDTVKDIDSTLPPHLYLNIIRRMKNKCKF